MNAARSPRTALSLVLALVAGLVGVALTAGPAAADAYRYWGYYHLAGDTWEFATTGGDGFTPEDGAVEGYRFAVSGPTDSRPPRFVPTFDEVCADTTSTEGQKRVGVVIDYGRTADAVDGATPPEPRTACAVVDTAATGDEVLAAVAELRMEEGLTCALDGYPETGCGDALADDAVTPEMAAAEEPITAPVADTGASSEGADGTDAADEGGTDPAEEMRGSLPSWAWALVSLAVIGALVLVIVKRTRGNRLDN